MREWMCLRAYVNEGLRLCTHHVVSEVLRRAQLLLPIEHVRVVIERAPQLNVHWTSDEHVGRDRLNSTDGQRLVFDQEHTMCRMKQLVGNKCFADNCCKNKNIRYPNEIGRSVT